MAARYVFTSESVTEGHPDKVCDQVSDGVLDAILDQDPRGRVACETLATKELLFVTGEITAEADVDYEAIARSTVEGIGYHEPDDGLSAKDCEVRVLIEQQSSEIAQGVGDAEGAGDQGLMFGYAAAETPELMPAPIMYAHKLARRLAKVRHDGTLDYLRPDGKSQVTLAYQGQAVTHANAIVVAAQHEPDVDMETLRADIKEHVVAHVVPEALLTERTNYYINHTGAFAVGGPKADAGLTGRKIIVDTYGGRAPHGGGAFSGKDPTKVDRSAAYYARYAAKNVVAAGLAHECLIQVAYSIASRAPVGVYVTTNGTGVVPDDQLEDLVSKTFDFTPGNMIRELDLRRPIYQQVAAYGHLGRDDLDVPWEKTDRAEELSGAAGGKARPPVFD